MSSGDAEQLLHEVVSAGRAHRAWLMRWHRHMLCQLPPEEDFHSAEGADLCRFGRWYREVSAANTTQSPMLASLGELHRAVHEEGRQLAICAKANAGIDPVAYDSFAATAEAFTRAVLSFERELRTRLADRDPLTNVANRRSMSRRLEDELDRVRDCDGRAWLAMIDVDRFKQLNDAHGHLAGDDVLRKVTQHVREQIRPYDMLFRYGGDEFLLCLRDVTQKSATTILERIRHHVHATGTGLGLGMVTLSIGMCEMNPHFSVDAALARADKALYAAKENGRNQVCVVEVNE